MINLDFTFTADLWIWQGPAAWHFVTLPGALAEEIRFFRGGQFKGFGSVPVQATIAGKAWKTSIFPDKKSGSYLLPIKAEIRRHAGISAGDSVDIRLNIRPD